MIYLGNLSVEQIEKEYADLKAYGYRINDCVHYPNMHSSANDDHGRSL